VKQLKISAVLCFVFLSLWSSLGQADTQFRIIVDASGSMQSNDPDHITSEALRLLADLSPENKATLGVWLFGEQPRVLFPETLVNSASKAKLASYVTNYPTQDVKTDLESILAMLLKTPDVAGLSPGYRRDWILVTDGMVDISRDESVNDASRQRIWQDLTQQLEAKGIHLHTISLTDYTDKALLDHLSYRTNATHTDVAVPEDLLDTFDQIFSQAAPAEELPLTQGSFDVDASVKEMTIEVLHETGRLPKLVQPNGATMPLLSRPGVYVSDAPHYTVFTVTNPSVGHWQLDNVNPERSHVRVVSDWVAKATTIPALVFTQEAIDSSVALFQYGQALTTPDQLSNIKVKQTLTRVAGGRKMSVLSWEMTPVGAEFKSRIDGIVQPGLYELTSVIQGESAAREIRQYITVQPAVSFQAKNDGANLVTFSASASNAKLDTSQSSMTLLLTYADGTQQREQMPFISEGYWEKIVPIGADSFAKVKATLVGVTDAGRPLQYTIPTWTIERQGDGDVMIQKGDLTATQVQQEDDSSLSSSQQVAALAVPPSIDVVGGGSFDENAAPAATITPKASQSVVAQVSQEMKSVTQASWFIYALIAAVAFVLIVLVFVFSRSSKSKGRYQSEESDDV